MDLAGKTLGTYQIVEEVGRGGMAVVYRAYQPSLNRYVAIKVLPPQLAFDRQLVERFLREARAAASLRHPNIVVIHDVGEQDGLYYIVMEYLEGRTLKEVIERQGALPPERAAHILDQVAAALDYAHQRGFVHRDVKPANIFVAVGDRATLTDFGIAKAVSEAQQLTRTGMLVGTPEYMSPEQAEGEAVDYRADLYALGIVMYQMLTGQVPFKGNTPNSTLYAVVHRPPPPPRQINPALPPAVETVVLRALAKPPDQRFQQGAQMVSALRSALTDRPRPVQPRPAARARRRSPAMWIVGALIGVLVLIVAALAVLLAGGGGKSTPPPIFTQVIVWQATPTELVEVVFTPSPELLATDTPGETPSPEPTDAAELPAETPTATDTTSPPPDTPTMVATATPAPTRTPTPTSTPPCPVQAQGLFAALWQTYRTQLGCPLYADPQIVQDAEQAFDNGHMFWRADNDRAYVVYEQGSENGTFQSFAKMWSEGTDPEYSCPASPPPGKVQPRRGFGAVWCSLGGASASIGWGLGEEVGFGPGNGDPLVQDFERGVIFRDSDGTTQGKAYVLFGDGTFKRVAH